MIKDIDLVMSKSLSLDRQTDRQTVEGGSSYLLESLSYLECGVCGTI